MKKTDIKFLLAEEKFMPEMHLREKGFAYSAYWPFTKNKERIQKFEETRDSRYIYQNELGKTCFQHDMAYGYFKNLTRRTASDKILRDKHLILLKIWTMMDINVEFFDKKNSGTGIKDENISSKELAEELEPRN